MGNGNIVADLNITFPISHALMRINSKSAVIFLLIFRNTLRCETTKKNRTPLFGVLSDFCFLMKMKEEKCGAFFDYFPNRFCNAW